MTGVVLDPAALEPVGPVEFAERLRRRSAAFRSRLVQLMLLGAFIAHPLPPETVERIATYARELSVDEEMIHVASHMADGSLGLITADFARAGYSAAWDSQGTSALHVASHLSDAWGSVEHDPGLATRWSELRHRPSGSLGRSVWEFYRDRGFVFPGRPGSAPPLLAQHDWVHVLADYGSTVEAEIEVFTLIARSNDDPRGFSLLAMVLGLFETGLVRTGAGLFEYDPGT
ncbi:MAG: hypothetical protein ACLQPH_07750 [Acidimicrobiales bacterium]